MKKTLIALCLAIALAVLLTACGGQQGFSSNEVKQYNETSTSIQAAVGQQFEISLASNPTTGYTWEKSEAYDKAYVELLSSKYIGPKEAIPGAGGTHQFLFKALKAGSTTIKLTYKRSWESTASDKTITYNVTIK